MLCNPEICGSYFLHIYLVGNMKTIQMTIVMYYWENTLRTRGRGGAIHRRLSSILGSEKSSALRVIPTQPLTGIKLNVDKLNIYLLYWYFQQNQCLKITQNTLYMTYINQHGAPALVGPLGNCPSCTCARALRRHCRHRMVG